jgi:hypothetical protein
VNSHIQLILMVAWFSYPNITRWFNPALHIIVFTWLVLWRRIEIYIFD